MTARQPRQRMMSRRVSLTGTFLLLAAGGTAACDNANEPAPPPETFYCATADGTVVDEDACERDGGGGSFFLWHSPGYSSGYAPGHKLSGGSKFAYNDQASRSNYGLPSTGKVGNGTVKTNVVGKGGGGTSGKGGTSGG